jgi:hypothetical protein
VAPSDEPSVSPSASPSGSPIYEIYQTNFNRTEVEPINTASTATDFYGYGAGPAYSFSGGIPVNDAVLVMLHEDSSGQLSLVLVVDGIASTGDGTSGLIEIVVSNVDDATLRDDPGDPYFYNNITRTIEMEFGFIAQFTDGLVAPFDLAIGECITVTPENDFANTGINSFQFVTGPVFDTTGALVLDLGESLFICKETAP